MRWQNVTRENWLSRSHAMLDRLLMFVRGSMLVGVGAMSKANDLANDPPFHASLEIYAGAL